MRRIVSLVPSLTEAIAVAGLENEIVGCTKFCVEPSGLHRKVTLIGGTKDPDLEQIKSLQPTHVVVNTEENKPEHIAWLRERFRTLETFPKAPQDVPMLFAAMGQFFNAEGLFTPWQRKIEQNLMALPRHGFTKTCLYLIWREPYMLAGVDSYISEMLALLQIKNICPKPERYPSVSVEEMAHAKPDMILFSSEPYPFRYRDLERLAHEWPSEVPLPELRKADGQLFSWYGTKTADALAACCQWLAGEESRIIGSVTKLSSDRR